MTTPPLSSPLLYGSLLLAAAGTAYATTPEQLPTVVVTASGHEQQLREAPASVSVLGREQLQQKPFASLADALRDLAGVSINGNGNNDAAISIRGMPGEYTLILVDGRRLNTRETANRGSSPEQLSLLPPLAAIERVELVRGPMSSLYGADALGGVVNIITRKGGKAWHGQLSLDATVQQHDQLGDSHNASFWVGGPLGEALGLQLYGSRQRRDEDKLRDGNADRAGDNVGARLTLTPAAGHELSLDLGRSAYDTEQLPGASLAAVYADGPNKGKPLSSAGEQFQRDYWSLAHRGRWAFGSSQLSLQQERGKLETLEKGVPVGAKPLVENSVLDGSVTLPLSAHTVKLGGQVGQQRLSGIAGQASVAKHPTNQDVVKADNWALFAEDQYALSEALTLTAGARHDHDSRYGNHFSPRLYAVYALNPAWTLRGGVSSGFKAPSLRQSNAGYCQTTGNATPRKGALCGNPALKPEQSRNAELGARYDGSSGSVLAATLFHSELRNKVVSYDTGAVDPLNSALNVYRYDNLARAISRGVELNASLPLSPALALSGNYTYTDSQRRGGNEPAYDGSSLDGKPLDKTPKHVASLRLDWRAGDALSGYARVNHTGKQYWAAFRNGASGVRERKASTTLDLGGQYQASKSLAVNVALLNAGDHRQAVDERARSAGLSGNWQVDDGRRLWLGLTSSF